MSNLMPLTNEEKNNHLNGLYEKIQFKFGKVPHIFQNLAHSPLVLESFLNMSEFAGKIDLPGTLKEKIALIVGQTNQCQYCLSAHTAGAKSLGMDDTAILEAREGISKDDKTQKILTFVKIFVEKKGIVSKADFESLKSAQITDQEIVNIFYLIMLNMFTNYFNHLAEPEVDFPPVDLSIRHSP